MLGLGNGDFVPARTAFIGTADENLFVAAERKAAFAHFDIVANFMICVCAGR